MMYLLLSFMFKYLRIPRDTQHSLCSGASLNPIDRWLSEKIIFDKFDFPDINSIALLNRYYRPGQMIETAVELTANHRGHFQFRLCPVNDPKVNNTIK